MKPKKPCQRTIRPSKYERNDTSNVAWWQEMCKVLEKKHSRHPHQKADVVKNMFSEDMAERILRILSFDKEEKEKDKVKYLSTITLTSDQLKVTSATALAGKSKQADHPSCFDSIESLDSFDIASKSNLMEEIETSSRNLNMKLEEQHLQSALAEIRTKREIAPGAPNPYMQFFKRREDRAAVWRSLPPLDLENMDLAQKGEAITEAIASDFVAWLGAMGGNKETTLDVPTIKKMFEVGFNMHAATSLKVRVKEMPAVPQQVAEKRNLPQYSKRARLQRELQRDIAASRNPEKLYAFGKMLPRELRYRPPKDSVGDKWMGCKKVKRELVTMAAVWEGITNLRSTRGFCRWLMEHPDIPVPNYLRDKGLMNPEFLYETDSAEFLDADDAMDTAALSDVDMEDKTQQEDERSQQSSELDMPVQITF